MKSAFIEIIDLCVYGFAHPINASKAGNHFAVREVCHALMELGKTNAIDREQLGIWEGQPAALDIPTTYTHIVSEENPNPNNWAYFVADDSIEPTTTPADIGGFVVETGKDFHKVVMNAGGYLLQFDCDTDTQYDANRLGRVHKKNCDPRVCLSVPFPGTKTHYLLETPNAHPLSICGFQNTADGLVCSAQEGVRHTLLSKTQSAEQCAAVFGCSLNEEPLFNTEYTVSSAGVDVAFPGADGILLPAFLFDGVKETEILATNGQILVRYNGSFCKYTFSGEPEEYGLFFNRNGRYRAYKICTDKLHIETGDCNEL